MAFLVVGGCGADDPEASPQDLAATPAAYLTGERVYDARCAGCHGARGAGTDQGPPLVHRVYGPGHHADAAFHLAVRRGVRAHHWQFGDMPPIPDVSPSDVTAVVSYVRWLQRGAGIH